MNLTSKMTRMPSDPKIIRTGKSSAGPIDRLSRGLGWFGIGLGAVQLIAPRRLGRMLGLYSPNAHAMIRVVGAREIASGVVTLSTEKKIGLWGRVAGDAMDIAALTAVLNAYNPQRQTVGAALAAVLGVTALDLLAAGEITARSSRKSRPRDYSDRTGFPNGVGRDRVGRIVSPRAAEIGMSFTPQHRH
jgi:hypothetical protein